MDDDVQKYACAAKIAAAKKILQKKPAEMSIRDYARSLCERYKQVNTDWKRRNKQLEMEILSLKQNMVLQNIRHTNTCSSSAEDIIDECPSFPPTPPCSSPNILQEEMLTQNIHFLQMIMSLKTLQHTLCMQSHDEVNDCFSCNTLKDSVLCHLKTMNITIKDLLRTMGTQGLSRDDRTLSLQNSNELSTVYYGSTKSSVLQHVKKSVPLILSLLDGPFKYLFEKHIEAFVTEIVDEVSCSIIAESRLGQHDVLEDLSLLVVSMGSCVHFKGPVVLQLLHHISQFSKDIREETKSGNFLENINRYENIYHIFSACESILRCINMDENGSIGLNALQLNKICKLLDCSVLHLSDHYPLYAHYIWRLKGFTDSLRKSVM